MNAQSIYKSPEGEKAIMAVYESVLVRWPVPYQAQTVSTRHGNTFVIACGEEVASPLVLLHGAGSNSAFWAADAAEYSRQYRVYAVDLLGEPGKSAPNRPAWDGPAYAEWLEDVLDALKADRAIVIGQSQGGWTALKFAVYKPERAAKLALLSPGGVVPDRMSFIARVIPLSFLGKWGARRINRLVLAGQPVPPEVDDAMTLIMTQFKSRIGTLPLFTDDELRRLTMPVLLLMGEKDALRDAGKIAARLGPLVPQLTVTVLPEAGHALTHTAKNISNFLEISRRK